MPPKIKVTKEDIIKTSLEIVRRSGAEAINARSIANELGCSTQPIFSNFSSMEELEESVALAAHKVYLGFLDSEAKSGKYPKYKAFGMAYVRFAKEERELFKFLFMCDMGGKTSDSSPDFEASVEYIMKASGISRERASLMHLELWSCVHGIATMLATSFLELDSELVSKMLSDIYQGLCKEHVTKGEKE